ncbi:MAG: META domain-containing protein, partial [Candidatus Omnitrophica bacterium]|nr:META domain-containing protein [Candidatus Omnitrophota bacterium]
RKIAEINCQEVKTMRTSLSLWFKLSIGAVIWIGASMLSTASPVSTEVLRNMIYQGIDDVTGEIKLNDGEWEGAPFVEGGAARPTVTFVDGFRLDANLDNQGGAETLVLLGLSMGGSGELLYLAVVGEVGGEPRNLATVLIGDRVGIVNVETEGHRVLMDVLRAGPDDPACCPGELATIGWEWNSRELKSVKTGVEPLRFTLKALEGTKWKLTDWDFKTPVTADATATLQFNEVGIFGNGGCNRYSAQVMLGDLPGDIKVGPAIATQMACPGPGGKLESRFLRRLQSVIKISFLATRLGLTYEIDQSFGTMYFERMAID